MTISPKVLRQRLSGIVHRLRGFRGNVDGFDGGSLQGWVAATDGSSMPLRVGVYTSGGLLTQGTANILRGDLKTAGVGNGHHGFALPLDPGMLKTIRKGGGTVEVRLLGESDFRVGRHHFSAPAQTGDAADPEPAPAGTANGSSNGRGSKLREALFGDLDMLERLLEAAPPAPDTQAPPAFAPHALMFSDSDIMNGGHLPAPMTAYGEYVRYRYKLDEGFDLATDPVEAEHFMGWYLAGYAPLRSGLRVPLSRDQIAWLNAPMVIGGKRATLTRATWMFLLDVPPLVQSMNFDNPAWVNWVVYWWAVNQAKAIHSEDCLVPEVYAERLRQIPDGHDTDSFAPSEFMVRMAQETPALAALDLSRPDAREKLALAMVTMTARRPDFLRFIPVETLKAVFETPAGKTRSRFADFADGQCDFDVPDIDLAGYAALMRLQGFDLTTGRFLTFTDDGHRMEAAMLPAVTGGDLVDIQMIGPFQKASGLGQATRLSAQALSHTPYSVNAVDFGLDNPAPEGFSRVGALSEYKRARINLIHLNAESIPLAYAYQPDVFSGSYNIGYFFWELDSPAACHHLGMEMLDEIWVSTEYGVQIFQTGRDKPVNNVGMCFEELPEIPREEGRALVTRKCGVSETDFVFLVAFDSFSFIQRKNPIGVLKAFAEAFDDTDDVRLVIKTQNRRKVSDPVQIKIWEEVDRLIKGDPRIVILDETLTYDDLLRLKKGCDCYISLHRSEGWGFGMIEAMSLGVPVICTGYSGNMDFCAEDTAWLVDYKEVELKPDDYIFVVPGQKWAEPDHDDTVAKLRAVHADPDARATRAEAALRNARENFSDTAIARRYQARIEEILATL
ncbi:MAG: glycosyltransferase family 4 protein [Pseudooceanicola sp.]